MECEKSFCPANRAASRATDELVNRSLERQRARLDFLAQRVPGGESVFASHHRLSIVQRKIRGADLFESPA